MQITEQKITRSLKWIFYSAIVGVLAGIAAAIFLITLKWATDFREDHQWIIWLLPFAGLFIGIVYTRYGGDSGRGTGLILEEIHNPKKVLPFRMAPFVLVGTLLTHLFGGSAGREGTAVQMGSTLADQLSKFFKIDPTERKILLMAGAGAGFSAAIGAPIAGAIFGLEVIQIGRFPRFAVVECIVASFVAYFTCLALQAPHSHFPSVDGVSYSVLTLGLVLLCGFAFGLAANIFVRVTHRIEHWNQKYIKRPELRPFFAGLLLTILFFLEGSYRYAGLGIEYIQQAFHTPAQWYESVMKLFFTALTVGSGFKGGEFIPLVFIGTTLGSFFSTLIPVSITLLSALGFAAVFGAGANTPIACAVMACELFGWQIAPHALIACLGAYYVTGHIGFYKNQKVVTPKTDQLLKLFRLK